VSAVPAPRDATPTSAGLGRPRLHLRRTASTNERARELAIAGAPHGTLVTASEQTAGRGRQGRHWSAPPHSSVLMSLLLRWPISDRSPELLPLMAAVAVCDAAGEQALIKWPNDVVTATDDGAGDNHLLPAGERSTQLAKLAGILVEARPQQRWAVLGIGLNVAVRLEDLPAELRPGGQQIAGEGSGLPAATLGLAPSDVELTLARLLGALERRLTEDAATTLEAWRARDALRGREVVWSGGRGRADGIDGTGRLVVSLAGGGSTTLGSGEVHLLRIGERR
jgi:BirA family biotin operon repressor/biotin-[acetyl-CoA-carboxylase] ligase